MLRDLIKPGVAILMMALLWRCATDEHRLTRADLLTPFEMDSTKTTTWAECIAYYARLDSAFNEVTLLEAGPADVGKPLHLVTVSDQPMKSPADVGDRAVLLVMNNIHPGEPEGADASMMLARELVLDSTLRPLLGHVVVLIIPMYNVDGALNRGMTRANQNGPREHGFRGNARNLDLNRDFMKADALNTRTFMQVFQEWQPHVFVDNHTTDGADYQPVMTLISTQKDKLHPLLAEYMTQELDPFLYEQMNAPGALGMIPYVDVWGGAIPDSGMRAFLETPRYSTGFTTLFNTIGYVAEAHMLKPFPQRVQATYDLMLAMTRKLSADHEHLASLRTQADDAVVQQDTFALNWTADSTFRWIDYPGYEASFRTSEITGRKVAQYDRSKPFVKRIKYFDNYTATTKVAKPHAYLIPQAWREAIELLKLNGVPMERLARDTLITAEAYYIESYETVHAPYEGHYLHHGTTVSRDTHELQFYAGDYIISLRHRTDRFVVEALEPEAIDSWFNWNFFDEVLQQKEWFSPWLFDSAAVGMIADNPELQHEFDQWLLDNPGATGNEWAMLSFFHQRSKFYEKTVRRYPVGRVLAAS
jgi:hypothetical protein